MTTLHLDPHHPLATDRNIAVGEYIRAARTQHWHHILDITRLVTAAIPAAVQIVIDTDQRPTGLTGHTLQQVLAHDGRRLWERYTAADPALDTWRTDDGATWADALRVTDENLGTATRAESLTLFGWRELDQPGHFHALRLPDCEVLTGDWAYLEFFQTPDTNDYSYARRACPGCNGEGLIPHPTIPHGTDTCGCVRTATW